MKVTVFTSCYNQADFLPRAVESVLRQTHEDIEYILIDDGSSDGTKDIIADYAKLDSRILPVYLSKYPNVASVLNLSHRLMHSDIWVWVPSDDTINDDLIEKKLLKINDNNIVLAWGQIVDENDNHVGVIKFDWQSSQEFRDRIWNECFIGMTGMMAHRSVLDKVGKFPEHLQFSEDFYWILRSTQRNVEYAYVAEALYNKRVHGNRLTYRNHDKIINMIPEIKREVLQTNMSPRLVKNSS